MGFYPDVLQTFFHSSMTSREMRVLSESEILQLEKNYCKAEDWSRVKVSDTFSPESCYDVTFSGDCMVADLSGYHENEFGIKIANGIRHAHINNCRIGNHVCIHHVNNFISNYDIGDDCVILNANTIAMQGESTFGIGEEVAVMNETGGMEVPLSTNLSAPIAFMLALMGQDKKLREKIYALVDKEADEVRSSRGMISNNVSIVNADTIINARIGEYAVLRSVTLLKNCTLCSKKNYPIFVGHDVQGVDFIASEGVTLKGGANVERCFIGQATVLNHQYSAHDSLFFANCNLENGEACAVFAGPFTVSNHKSSLLIAGHFSFLNAGSGSNQSNHLYKLGPIHRGVAERGSKTSSDSYILWPSRIGAFSLIMGRHVDHVDTTDFPFSYIIENDNRTYVVPGRNLLSVGTMRDAKKWPARDKRPEGNKLDCVNYNLLSPFSVGKMETAYSKLKNLYDFVGGNDHVYAYNNFFIRPASLTKGMQIYRWGIEKFIGNSLITRIYNKFGLETIPDIAALRDALLPDDDMCKGKWIDMSGMIAPADHVNILFEQIKNDELDTIERLNTALRNLHENYYDFEWGWSYELMCRWYDLSGVGDITIEIIKKILDDWINAVLSIDQALYDDAQKEYSIISKVNLGIGVDSSNDDDFLQEEDFEENDIVKSVVEHIDRKKDLFERVQRQLAPLV